MKKMDFLASTGGPKRICSSTTTEPARDRGYRHRGAPPLQEGDTTIDDPKVVEALNRTLAQEHAHDGSLHGQTRRPEAPEAVSAPQQPRSKPGQP
jgi:hypothetical protein